MTSRCAGLLLLLGVLLARPAATQETVEPICPGLARSGGSVDLYCIKLFAAGGFDARGAAELRWPGGPFTVAVTRNGVHQWNLRFELAALPDSLVRRKGAGFVAWAAPPSMATMQRLGVVAPGRELGPVALDRFLVFVTAEPDTTAREVRGPIILRGESASNRLRPPDTWQFFVGAAGQKRTDGLVDAHAGHAMPGRTDQPATTGEPRATDRWSAGVPMFPGLEMLPSEMALRPTEGAWLPSAPAAPMARPGARVTVAAGDTLELVAGPVRRVVGGREVTMLGFNGQYPGPLIEARQGTEIVVRLVNRLDAPTTVHWHGIRLENRFDGVPGSTQDPVEPGGEFVYRLRFPDTGTFWYHPHVREDVQQDLGLYGNIVVRQHDGPVDGREEFLILDDLLVGEAGLVPYGAETPTHAAMGRFGNLMLVNGEPRWHGTARPGETIRFHFTNVANTRTFNVSFGPGVRLEVVGSDLGPYQRPQVVESVVIAPAERYIVDATFTGGGAVALMNRVRAIDHLYGRFFSVADTLGVVKVSGQPATVAGRTPHASVPEASSPLADGAAKAVPAPDSGLTPARTLEFRVEFSGLPFVTDQLMRLDSAYTNPVEWEGTMPTMNWSVTGREARWIVQDAATGRENMDIQWRFRRGEQVRIRLVNSRNTLHGMQHPIHLHGQRLLVLAVNGKRNENPVWKDTVLLPSGTAIDILAEMSNPGTWMLHCHIAEHLQSQMMMHFEVE